MFLSNVFCGNEGAINIITSSCVPNAVVWPDGQTDRKKLSLAAGFRSTSDQFKSSLDGHAMSNSDSD